MDLLPFPLSSASTPLEDPAAGHQPLHDIRELFELAFPLLTDREHELEDSSLADVIPLRP